MPILDELKRKANGAADSAKNIEEAIALMDLSDEYVTPEMYGAVGDGVTDDSDAIIKAIKTEGVVVRMDGTYAVSKELQGSAKAIIGDSAKIVLLNDVDRLFNLSDARLVTGLEFDCNNFGATSCIFCSSETHEISSIEVYDLSDTRTNKGTQIIFSLNADSVSIHDINVHDCSHIGNGVVADAEGNITCIYASHYAHNCTIYNVTIEEIHNVDSEGNIILEDGGGVYVQSASKQASTYIQNIYGRNYCKKLIKSQCFGCVIVNGVNAYTNSVDNLAAIGIQSTESEDQTEYGKGIISNCHLVNEYNSGNQVQYLITSSENVIISNCYFSSPYQYAILNVGDIRVVNCEFSGYAVINNGRSLRIERCSHEGNGFLYNPNSVGNEVYMSGCDTKKIDLGGTLQYPSFSNVDKPIHLTDCVMRNANIESSGEISMTNVSFVDVDGVDRVYLKAGANLVANGITVNAPAAVVRAINLSSNTDAFIKNLKTTNITFSITGTGNLVLGEGVDLSLLYNQYASISNEPAYVDTLPDKSTMPANGLYAILKSDGKLYKRVNGVWTAVN